MTITNALDNIKLITNYLETESIAFIDDLEIYNYYEMERLTGLKSYQVLEILEYLLS
jgi:hypothetical protein